MVFGLGFVLSFGYWCTNFLVVQRAMAARNMGAARRTPLIAAVPKMLFPALVILPGMIAVALTSMPAKNYRIPPPALEQQAVAAAVAAVEQATHPTPGSRAGDHREGQRGPKRPRPQDRQAKEASRLRPGQAGRRSSRPTPAKPIDQDQRSKALRAEFVAAFSNAMTDYDYDGVILSLVKKYCPTGMLGLALTALLASFMSGMAGNVTAFNTVWTYDLYQAYIARNKSDQHYFWMGQAVTVAGILLSIACAYFARQYNNAMDIIQLVFGFVNAPLVRHVPARHVLGPLHRHRRLPGPVRRHQRLGPLPRPDHRRRKQPRRQRRLPGRAPDFPQRNGPELLAGQLRLHRLFQLTFVISLLTRRTKTNEELKGLVYSLTPKLKDEGTAWYLRPATLGVVLLACCVVLNLIFR